jgi:lambda family phage minor tail protein L
VGDTVTANTTANAAAIVRIDGNQITFDTSALSGLITGSKLLIVNPDADPSSYTQYTYTINRLDELDEIVAKFSLTNWLQYFKMKLPKRKFTNTTCPWRYRGVECKYPVSGSGEIQGSNPAITANGFFTYSNTPTILVSEDVCNKTLTACALRKNLVNFGGFPGLKNE